MTHSKNKTNGPCRCSTDSSVSRQKSVVANKLVVFIVFFSVKVVVFLFKGNEKFLILVLTRRFG